MNRLIAALASILLFFVPVQLANAAITVISQPDFDYLEATTRIDIGSITDGTPLPCTPGPFPEPCRGSITDGELTVTFIPDPDRGLRLEKNTVPLGWGTWSSPPDSESATPEILINENLSLTMDLSSPVTTFGFELQPNFDGPFDFDVDFVKLNGPTIEPTIVGTISLSLTGRSGARLFAATTEDVRFDRIIIRGGDYFAIAQIRYASDPVEVEIDVKPGDPENSIKLSKHRFVSVAILSGSGFDATTVIPSTVCFGGANNPGHHDCSETHDTGHIEDVDGDGDLDLLFHFDTHETGIDLSDTHGCLTGRTFGGVQIGACDAVNPRP